MDDHAWGHSRFESGNAVRLLHSSSVVIHFVCVCVSMQANILLTKSFEPKLCDLASSHLSSNSKSKSKHGLDERRRRISSVHLNMDTTPLYAPPEALDTDASAYMSLRLKSNQSSLGPGIICMLCVVLIAFSRSS